MFDLFTNLQSTIVKSLQDFIVSPVNALTGGIAIFSMAILTVWFLYNAYLILIGANNSDLMSFLKDFALKVMIVVFAGTASYYNAYLGDKDSLLITVNNSLAETFSPNGDSSIFSTLERKISVVSKLLETVEGIPKQDNSSLIDQGEDTWAKPIFKTMAKVDDFFTNSSNAVASALVKITAFIKLLIIQFGLAFFSFFAFITYVTNQFFFYICLGVGPLFIFFAAFNITKGWFSAWLNVTLGYCFTFPLILLVLSFLMKIFDKLFIVPNADGLGWNAVILCLLLCLVFGVVITRIGDIASSFFSAGNISDGTIAAGMIAAKGGIRKLASGGKGLAKASGKAGKAARNAYRRIRNPRISNADSN